MSEGGALVLKKCNIIMTGTKSQSINAIDMGAKETLLSVSFKTCQRFYFFVMSQFFFVNAQLFCKGNS